MHHTRQQSLWRAEIGNLKYYLLTDLEDNGVQGFNLTISDGDKVWREHVDSKKVETLAAAVEMSPVPYMEQTARVLTGQGSGQEHFVYQVKMEGTGSLKFLWKKQVGDGVKFQLGSLTLPELADKVSTIKHIFDLAIEQTAQLKENISSLQSDNARLSAERKSALKLLDKCVSAKEGMEIDLYQKFSAVLNDKKAKIRILKEKLEEAPMLPQPSTSASGLPSSSKTTTADERTQDRHYDSDTEDETESTNSNLSSPSASVGPRVSQPSKAVPSPSLLPDEEDIRAAPVAAKRRRRRDPKTKESSAKKLVLPKVPSIKKTPSNSSGESISSGSRTRLRKRLSEKAEVDVDDLMAEM